MTGVESQDRSKPSYTKLSNLWWPDRMDASEMAYRRHWSGIVLAKADGMRFVERDGANAGDRERRR